MLTCFTPNVIWVVLYALPPVGRHPTAAPTRRPAGNDTAVLDAGGASWRGSGMGASFSSPMPVSRAL
jgi:hypothetical protein